MTREEREQAESEKMADEQTKQVILGFTEFFKGITGNQNLEIPSEIAEKCGIQAQAEKTCDIEKSNFDMRQYKLDTDTAYECGYNAGLKAQADGDYINRILKRMWNWRSKNATSIDKVAMEMILREELPSMAIPSADIEQAYMKGREDGVNDFIKKSLIDE